MKTSSYLSRTWINPRQEFRPSPIHGVGSFARAPIRQGEVIEIVGGIVMTEAEFHSFIQSAHHFNAIQIDEQLHLVEPPAITHQRGGGSLNHSCDSNLWMADAVTLIARRDIAAGEELTVDYALFTAGEEIILEHHCRCGSPVCRKIIGGADWQIPAVQARYYPHFSPFINARIDRLRQAQDRDSADNDHASYGMTRTASDQWAEPAKKRRH